VTFHACVVLFGLEVLFGFLGTATGLAGLMRVLVLLVSALHSGIYKITVVNFFTTVDERGVQHTFRPLNNVVSQSGMMLPKNKYGMITGPEVVVVVVLFCRFFWVEGRRKENFERLGGRRLASPGPACSRKMNGASRRGRLEMSICVTLRARGRSPLHSTPLTLTLTLTLYRSL
jgi:hypothetical protein